MDELVLLESIIKDITYKLLEDKDKDKKDKKYKKDAIIKKSKQVKNMLKDPKINHAEIMRQLWHPKANEEDTYRSLFSKKLRGVPNDDGTPYHFTPDEIIKIYAILQSK
jgi:hypothetical protein